MASVMRWIGSGRRWVGLGWIGLLVIAGGAVWSLAGEKGTPVSVATSPALRSRMLVVTAEGKEHLEGPNCQIVFDAKGEVCGLAGGKKVRLREQDLRSHVARLDFYPPKKALVTKRDGSQLELSDVYFNCMQPAAYNSNWFYVRTRDPITGKFVSVYVKERPRVKSVFFSTTSPVRCRPCKKQFPPDYRYCPYCGRKLPPDDVAVKKGRAKISR